MWDSKTYRYAVETGLARGMEQGLQQGLAQGRELGMSQGEARGRLQEARRFLTRFAEHSLGSIPATAQARLASIDDVDAIERLADRLPDARSWDELLAP
jgi:flagellar biosynthesis/type III secretory pathway protein FliH